ncbi:hypothetical protein CCP3SC15_1260009 [Gammaproteobacteria bacterium]
MMLSVIAEQMFGFMAFMRGYYNLNQKGAEQ